jgi:hypothetical protein
MAEYPPFVYWILALVPLYYLGMPLLVWFRQKMQAHPRLEPLDLNQLSPALSDFLMQQTKALYAIGFDEPTLVQLPRPASNVSTYLILLVKRDTGDKATVTVVVGHGPTPIRSCGVEFSTRFDTGEVFDTHNYDTLMAFPPLPSHTRTQVPPLKDCAELFSLHNHVMGKYPAAGKKVLYEPGKALEYLVEFAFAKFYEERAKQGWLYYDEVEDVYRFTLMGAYLVTGRLLQPFKALRHAMVNARAKSILREFRSGQEESGLAGDS